MIGQPGGDAKMIHYRGYTVGPYYRGYPELRGWAAWYDSSYWFEGETRDEVTELIDAAFAELPELSTAMAIVRSQSARRAGGAFSHGSPTQCS